jgi:Leucine-rich repeat (LRR) protein
METQISVNKNITDASISRLLKLKTIEFGNNFVTDASLKLLTNLTSLDLGCVMQFSDDSVQYLTKLQRLNCNYNEVVTDFAVSKLVHLETLNLANNHQVTPTAFLSLTNLQQLDMGFSRRMGDSAMLVLAKLPNFQRLNMLVNCNITAGVLAQMTNLLSLSASQYCTCVTDQSLRALSNLVALDLFAWKPDAVSQTTIDTLTRLTHLFITGADIDPAYLKAHGQLIFSQIDKD